MKVKVNRQLIVKDHPLSDDNSSFSSCDVMSDPCGEDIRHIVNALLDDLSNAAKVSSIVTVSRVGKLYKSTFIADLRKII